MPLFACAVDCMSNQWLYVQSCLYCICLRTVRHVMHISWEHFFETELAFILCGATLSTLLPWPKISIIILYPLKVMHVHIAELYCIVSNVSLLYNYMYTNEGIYVFPSPSFLLGT